MFFNRLNGKCKFILYPFEPVSPAASVVKVKRMRVFILTFESLF
jgi:hypothetical protein